MYFRDYIIITFATIVSIPFVLTSLEFVNAQVMQSTNYRIQSDSVNFAGGLSTSTQYTLESTLGEIATGDVSGTSYNLKSGYQRMEGTYIAMTTANPIIMSPSLPGITGGEANGSTTVTVTTDSPAGYTLSIKSETSPALVKGSDSISDYTPIGNPDFTFSTGSTDAHFGYSPSGVDTASRFKDNGSACNIGSGEVALACWDGLDTVDETVVLGASANTPNGATTTIYFRVGIGGSVVQPEGVYSATTTLTTLPQ